MVFAPGSRHGRVQCHHTAGQTEFELVHIYAAARTSGNNVVLDTLLLWLHVETTACRGGVLGPHRADLDTELCGVVAGEGRHPPLATPISPTPAEVDDRHIDIGAAAASRDGANPTTTVARPIELR